MRVETVSRFPRGCIATLRWPIQDKPCKHLTLRWQTDVDMVDSIMSVPHGTEGARMLSDTSDSSSSGSTTRHADFVDSLSAFSRQHRAQHWEGTFGDFLTQILPANPAQFARSSHQYIWDMLRWYGRSSESKDEAAKTQELFRRELFGVNEPLGRVADYFKAAAAGSDVGRRLLLLLGPPSGGKSTLAILLKRGLEEYSRTDEGALYGIKGSPMHESPLNLIPASLRAQFRDTYGVELTGELSPWAREKLEREYDGDYLRVPVERIFIAEP